MTAEEEGAAARPTETVLTSRRALLLRPGAPVAGRLRLSETAVRFEPLDGAPVEVVLSEVRRVAVRRGRRGALVVETRAATLRLRCFNVPAVAALLLQARAG